MFRNNGSRSKPNELASLISIMFLIIGLLLIGIVILFMVRLQRGLIGLVLAGIAAFLIIYWMKEIRTMILGKPKSKSPSRKWTYDIIEDESVVTIVAEIPGPTECVKVEYKGGLLTLFGGERFKKKVSVQKGLSLSATSYINGILNVKLSKVKKLT